MLGLWLLVLTGTPVRGADNIVFNGGFEQGGTGWGWTYNRGIAYGLPDAADGRNWCDVFGTIYQDLPTVAGQEYQLRFALAGNCNIGTPQVIDVLWGEAAVGSASWSPIGHTIDHLGWVWTDLDLVASDSSTHLTFSNPYVGDGSGRIARVDAISVIAIPEPAALPLISIGLAAFAAFKRQR